jgi:flavodoxin I
MTIGLFYSTTSGATKQVAETIRMVFGGGTVELHNIDVVSPDKLKEYDKLIFGAPTMGLGELSDEWEAWIGELSAKHVRGKTVALFGLGDQEGYPDTFVDALGIIRDKLLECDAELVGEWPSDGYDFVKSKAEKAGKFAGLVIDDDNQPRRTNDRVREWVESIRSAMD